MSRMLTASVCWLALTALAAASSASAQVAPTPPPAAKKARAVWTGVEVIQTAWTNTRVSPAGSLSPGDVVESIVINFTYIEEPNFHKSPFLDGQIRWTTGKPISQKISWHVFRHWIATGWMEVTCHGGGELELVGMSREAVEESLKPKCDTKMITHPNAYWRPGFPSALPVKPPKIVKWKDLRDGTSYSEELPWEYGRHTYSVSVKKTVPCGEYNESTGKPDMDGKSGEIQVVPDSSSILPDGQTILHVTFTCESQPVKSAKLEVTIDPQANSGGHVHGGKRPRGKLNEQELTDAKPTIEIKTGSDGKADVLFEPAKSQDQHHIGIAGIYKVSAKGANSSEGAATVVAEVKGLQPLADGSSYVGGPYVIVRNHSETHPAGTHATEATRAAIARLAVDFSEAQLRFMNGQLTTCKPPKFAPAPLSINDLALPQGGHFDWEAKWKGSHQTHGKGMGGDFNHFYETQAIPDCDSKYPAVPLSAWLSALMLELGEKYGYWDEADMSYCSDWQEASDAGVSAKCPGFPLFHLHVNQ